ncbi:MAG TPA: two-component regulator propeller domain-containing protein, partial [Blastocatellia bacterium]|nr:two-component regulator propeller domain-containing protein [Blastocatellia bacterium]
MNSIKTICLLLSGLGLLLFMPTTARGERLPIKTYTTSDGLVSNRISRIVRDSRGYLWFCTENGLSRFDGYSFTNYTTHQGLPDNDIDDLLETRDGTYWVATAKGLCRYNPRGLPLSTKQSSLTNEPMFVVYRPDGEPSASVIKTLFQDRSGAIWVGTWRGLYRLEQIGAEVRFHFVELGMPPSEPQRHVIRNMLEDHQGALWMTTDCGLYRRWPDGRVDRFTANHGLASDNMMGLAEDRHGRIWVGNRSGGLCLLVSEPVADRAVVERRYTTKDGLGCVFITSIYKSSDGRVWAGADCGLSEMLFDSGRAGQTITVRLS